LQWFAEEWPRTWLKYPISVRELYPVIAVINSFGHKMKNAVILFHCDNQAIMLVINSQYSKGKKIMALLQPLILSLLLHNIAFRAEYIPYMENTIADTLSHTQVTGTFLQENSLQRDPVYIPSHLRPEDLKV
jgi:hypothetical protein